MTAELQRRLTWEDATERFLDVAELKASDRPGALETAVDKLAWVAHNTLTGTCPALAASSGCDDQPISVHMPYSSKGSPSPAMLSVPVGTAASAS